MVAPETWQHQRAPSVLGTALVVAQAARRFRNFSRPVFLETKSNTRLFETGGDGFISGEKPV
jgi:hypothetical protein